MKEYPEVHQQGLITLESMPEKLRTCKGMGGDLGIQITKDGRVWVCINEIAFLQFKPLTKEQMKRYEKVQN